ncbi:hypothetical protein Cgig2_008300 [Carnegiea gigantea]|uniref:Uncharacterized protein n=1 Tax=Carnegiea gigantea TaxID=171969 RepID=A0A9Q1H0Y4_9CARY|nr:hypothetical protein Cgig2_008300 [Carnegiea gigantea]
MHCGDVHNKKDIARINESKLLPHCKPLLVLCSNKASEIGLTSMIIPTSLSFLLLNKERWLATFTSLKINMIYMCRPFSDEVLKRVMFSIPNFMPPGVDGYSSGFFKCLEYKLARKNLRSSYEGLKGYVNTISLIFVELFSFRILVFLSLASRLSRNICKLLLDKLTSKLGFGAVGKSLTLGENKAVIAMHVWGSSKKNDNSWVRWIYGDYLKHNTWWDHSLKLDKCWY